MPPIKAIVIKTKPNMTSVNCQDWEKATAKEAISIAKDWIMMPILSDSAVWIELQCVVMALDRLPGVSPSCSAMLRLRILSRHYVDISI